MCFHVISGAGQPGGQVPLATTPASAQVSRSQMRRKRSDSSPTISTSTVAASRPVKRYEEDVEGVSKPGVVVRDADRAAAAVLPLRHRAKRRRE